MHSKATVTVHEVHGALHGCFNDRELATVAFRLFRLVGALIEWLKFIDLLQL